MDPIHRRFLKLTTALLMAGSLGVVGASAAEIITPVAGDAAPAAAGAIAPQVVASQLARIDSAGLTAGLQSSSLTNPLVLTLLPGVSVPLTLTRTDPTLPGMAAFAAQSPGDAYSSATIVIDKGTVYAVVQYKNATYEIRHLANGVHRIAKIDQDKFPREAEPSRARPKAAPSKAALEATVDTSTGDVAEAVVPAANTEIKVMIVATTLARSHHSDWASIAQAAITDANTAFKNSSVAITFSPARIAALSYNESGKTYNKLLDDAASSTSLKNARNTYKADLVAVLRDDSGTGNDYCGLGNFPTTPSAATKDYAYSVVNIGCAVGNHSYVHEAGHNMGLDHDRYVSGGFGADQSHYNYGYSNVAHLVRTVMAYANYCNSKGVSCTRVGFFSNPNKSSNGGVLGVAVGKKDAAYNAYRLNQTRAAIAAYR